MLIALKWQKSTFSGGGSGEDCVELAESPTGVHLRESDEPARVLTTAPAGLRSLIAAIKALN
ncbi:DUF397 domain-containing protein [Streptomyces sp. ISL-96]|uniref:DUF397 domain-containing protein n=1 Tax=Streptomyces sp. ISL-96 TaxID=2819191 RepID=UPI001BE62D55|nr:DUF397 domain-containing protein [Streptomyces sp. ISL-96]MBT2488216.1 DUF397 domain-containing protein [Streptomyces sp. ISL-96]